MSTRIGSRRLRGIGTCVLMVMALGTIMPSPASAGQVGVTINIRGSGLVKVVEGSLEDDGSTICDHRENQDDRVTLGCGRIRNSEPFEAWVWLRPEAGDVPAGDWAFMGWQYCDTTRYVGGVQECGVHSGAFSSDERSPVAVFKDTVYPVVSNLQAAPSASVDRAFRATFDVTGGQARCHVDDEPAIACSSPYTATLSEGRHFIRVGAVDPSGNPSAVRSVEVRAVDTRITGGPPSLTSSRVATFTFASLAGTSYWCSLDGAEPTTCATSQDPTATVTSQSDGPHRLEVYAAEGQWRDHLPAVYTWTVDTSSPTTKLGTVTASGHDLHATFEAEAGAKTECRLLRGSAATPWASCTSPYRRNGLEDGDYVVEVRSTDTAGNVGSTVRSDAVRIGTAPPGTNPADMTPPDTRITAGPEGVLLSHSTSIAYTSSETIGRWVCTFDGRARNCPSSQAVLTGLRAGSHQFEVAATDGAGNLDLTPATRAFTVPMPVTSLHRGPGWRTLRSSRVWDGTAYRSSRKGATLTRSVKGARSFALVVSKGRGHGKVRVYAGKKLLRTVSLTSRSTRTKQVVSIRALSRPFTGTLRITVASSREPVQIEGLAVVTR
jgi:hypothetical protein